MNMSDDHPFADSKCVKNLRRWINFNSVSDRSNDPVNVDIAASLEELGFEVDLQSVSDIGGVVKTNVVARIGPDSGDGGLAYFCHTDVVPAVDWIGPGGAFDSTIQNSRVYGRGSCDMKGSLAAVVAAAENIDRQSLVRPLWIICTADEEVGFAGVRKFREHEQYASIVKHQPVAIIGEPTSMRVVYSHKGGERWQFEAKGIAAHSGTNAGLNANEAIAPVMAELAKITQVSREDPSLLNHSFDPPHLCINFGIQNAASAVNITPAWSKIWVFLRLMPGVDHQPLIDRVLRVAEQNGVIAKRLDSVLPLHVDPAMTHIVETAELVDQPPETVGYGTDGGELPDLKRRIVIGPGNIEQAHTSSEFVELDQLQRGVDIFAAMIRRATHR